MVSLMESKDYLSSLRAVRERCYKVQMSKKLQHFDVDQSKMQGIVQFVVSLIKRDFSDLKKIPQHSRWRHFDVGGRPRIQTLVNAWTSLGTDKTEQTRRILDLFVVALLLDITPATTFIYHEPSTNRALKNNQGIAVAILDMFMNGSFSSSPNQPHRVDAEALSNLTLNDLLNGFQTTSETLIGLEDRLDLLHYLGDLLSKRPDYFGGEQGGIPRPGNMIDYLLSHPSTIKTKKGPLIPIEILWPVVMEMGEMWTVQDEKCQGGTYRLGDVFCCPAIGDEHVAFHKLSQWMCYSLIEPMEKLLGAIIEGTEQLTPIADYANGGLLIDTGLLTLKKGDYERGIENYKENSLLPGQPKVEVTPMFEMSDPVVVEWRALTVAYIEIIMERVRAVLKTNKKALSLSQLIEGGTHNAGKEIAEISRPNTQEPPIVIRNMKRVIF